VEVQCRNADEFNVDYVRDTFSHHPQMALVLTFGSMHADYQVSRMAGQFANPQ
jgi:3-deoxy-D-arabino-heptulosonate 7-phosphate (DAHP) synthase class II